MNPRQKPCDIFLDSGAFAAWNRGETLDVRSYIQYIIAHEKLFGQYANLDVMPGNGITPMAAAEGSYDNLKRMTDKGLSPLPVYHHGEPLKWLDTLVKDGWHYIGLGGMAALKPEVKVQWLDQIFSLTTDKNGWPLLMFHGFGLTHPTLITRYPWYSVDSSTWSMFPGYGPILVPHCLADGKFDFTREPTAVVLSGNEQQSARANAMQYQNLTERERAPVDAWFAYVGIEITEARYKAGPRRRAMLAYFNGLQRAMKGVRFKHRKGLIVDAITAGLPSAHPIPWTLQIYHATAIGNKEFSSDLNSAGAEHRLISYYETRKRSSRELEQYVTEGIIGEYAKQRAKPNWEGEAYLNQRRMGIKDRFK